VGAARVGEAGAGVSAPPGTLAGLRLAVVGGDAREPEIARLAAAAGAHVRAYGFPWPPGGVAGVHLARSAAEAMAGADYAIFPVPGLAANGSLYAPESEATIVPTAALLDLLKPGAAIVLGRADERLRQAAGESGVGLIEYEDDTELMLLRGPAIVEGALAVAITNTPVTLHRADVGVVGFGNIGSLLARSLRALGASVHVFARNPAQRAGAYASACLPHRLEELAAVAPGLAMLVSTVPVPLVGRPQLEALPPGCLVVDIAAPPGSVDLALAQELGHTAIWARGLGRSAPRTVGKSQWEGISRRIAERERRRVAP
jgi:dipicolinate synthase subunit A